MASKKEVTLSQMEDAKQQAGSPRWSVDRKCCHTQTLEIVMFDSHKIDDAMFQFGWSPSSAAARVVKIPLRDKCDAWSREAAAARRAADAAGDLRPCFLAAATAIESRLRMSRFILLSNRYAPAMSTLTSQSLCAVCFDAEVAAGIASAGVSRG